MSYSIVDGYTALAVAGGLVGYLHVTHVTRRRRLEVIHEERMAAMEKGIPLPEFPMEADRTPSEPDPRTLPIMGIVFLALSIGAMVVLAVILPAKSQSFWVAPLPLAFLGAGLLGFHFLSSRSGF